MSVLASSSLLQLLAVSSSQPAHRQCCACRSRAGQQRMLSFRQAMRLLHVLGGVSSVTQVSCSMSALVSPLES